MGMDGPARLLVTNDNKIIGYIDTDGTVRLAVEAALKPGTTVNIGSPAPADPALIIRERLEDGGSSPDMRVNGSVTPVEFKVDADGSDDISLYELRFIMTADDIRCEGDKFGPIAGLADGVELEVRSNSVTTLLMTAKITEEFLVLPNPLIYLDRSGAKDVLACSYSFGGAVKLLAGTGDYVMVRINDNLTDAKFKYFQATISGVKE